ncbi:MAG: prolyl oligopeptidase family serine peptidase [Deltaproteobacteria bacterium]|nr:prolyl oligopeptidase family serine peptidase [Deltaproteobacteria bacterium]
MKYRTARPQPPLRVVLQNGDSAISGKRRKAVALPITFSFLLIFTMLAGACRHPIPKQPPPQVIIEPLGFQISSGEDHYQIEGYFARSAEPGRMPALLVLNGDGGNARQCIDHILQFIALRIRLACISLPGYGKSSGPSRFVGPQSIEAARRGLDLVAARPEVDPSRLAIWGIADGAVAAGLLMDSDRRAHAVILQSGAYDLLKLWPGAPIGTKLSILRQVWPSKRVLQERSVIENMPSKLDCNVLILHGERDRKTPVNQAQQLARALRERGAHVKTHFFADGSHRLGKMVDQSLREFLRANLALPSSNENS